MKLSNSLALLLLTSAAHASENNYQLQKHINPEPDSILEDLSQYSRLYIQVPKHSTHMLGHGHGNCVWSECGLDDQTDDLQMGDYRDGDGRWYRFRTQFFCANAAYWLYGVKKGDWNIKGGGCAKKHFINSFFTYDGADNLLKAVGISPDVYYDNNNGRKLQEQDDAVQGDDAQEQQQQAVEHDYGNANCVEINYGANDDANNAGANRNLQSNDVNDGYSSALGCDSKGNYIMAAFQGSSCNGNYFLDTIDSMDNYNDEFGNIGCHEIYTNTNQEDYTQEAIYTLLRDSWACDTQLYPHACPDPFGEKSIDEYALHSAAHGGSGIMAYRSQKMQKYFHIVSGCFLMLAFLMFLPAYYLKNKGSVAKKSSKGKLNKAMFGSEKDGEKGKKGMFSGSSKKSDGTASTKEIEMAETKDTVVESKKSGGKSWFGKKKTQKAENDVGEYKVPGGVVA